MTPDPSTSAGTNEYSRASGVNGPVRNLGGERVQQDEVVPDILGGERLHYEDVSVLRGLGGERVQQDDVGPVLLRGEQ